MLCRPCPIKSSSRFQHGVLNGMGVGQACRNPQVLRLVICGKRAAKISLGHASGQIPKGYQIGWYQRYCSPVTKRTTPLSGGGHRCRLHRVMLYLPSCPGHKSEFS